MPGCRVIASQSLGKKIWIIVLAEINEIYCALLRQSRVRFLASSRHFPVTFPSLSSNFRGPGLVVSWLENQRCDDIIMAGPFDCRMRHEVPNLQSIYLLKMCCNPFTHFWLPVRHEMPMLCHSCNPVHDHFDCREWGTKCQISSGYIAFIPFFVYFPEPFCLSDLFPAYRR